MFMNLVPLIGALALALWWMATAPVNKAIAFDEQPSLEQAPYRSPTPPEPGFVAVSPLAPTPQARWRVIYRFSWLFLARSFFVQERGRWCWWTVEGPFSDEDTALHVAHEAIKKRQTRELEKKNPRPRVVWTDIDEP